MNPHQKDSCISQKKRTIFALLAILMVLIVSVPSALAYFTTYARVKGTSELKLGEHVDFEESPSNDGHKLITLTVTEGDVFVRVKAYAVREVLDNMSYSEKSQWNFSEDKECNIYEYVEALTKGDVVELELIVDTDEIDLDTFNVVVVYEYVPAFFDTPNWDMNYEVTGGE